MSRIITNYALKKNTGAGQRLARAVMALAKAGFDVEYVTTEPPDSKHPNLHFTILKSPVSSATCAPDHRTPLFWIKYMINASLACRKIAKKADTTCLLAFTFGGSIPLLTAKFLSGKPLIIFLRSDEARELKIKGTSTLWRILFRVLEEISVNSANTIVVITNTMKETMINRHGANITKKIMVLNNDLPSFESNPANPANCRPKVVGISGRNDAFHFFTSAKLHKLKNIALIIEAMAQIKETHVHLIIAGNGPECIELKNKADKLGLADRITFAGWRNDTAELAGGCDVFILPSLAEGMSNSLLEALAAGTPCLISDIPEHREIFNDNTPLFDPYDADALAEKMQQAFADKSFLDKLKSLTTQAALKLSFDWNSAVVEIVKSKEL